MNKHCFLILILLSFVFVCKAQNNTKSCQAQNNPEFSPSANMPISSFARVPIFSILHPIPKTQPKKKSKSNPIPYKVYNPNIILLNLSLRIDCYKLSEGNIAAFFSLEIEDKELTFENTNNFQIARVEVSGHITSIDNKSQGNFEDKIIFYVRETDSRRTFPGGVQTYIKGILLPPGSYWSFFELRDSVTGRSGSVLEEFKTPGP